MSATSLRAVVRDARARVARVRDALHVGDVELAVHVLDDLELDLERALGRQQARCAYCPATFTWPGERDEHVARAHPEVEW